MRVRQTIEITIELAIDDEDADAQTSRYRQAITDVGVLPSGRVLLEQVRSETDRDLPVRLGP